MNEREVENEKRASKKRRKCQMRMNEKASKGKERTKENKQGEKERKGRG